MTDILVLSAINRVESMVEDIQATVNSLEKRFDSRYEDGESSVTADIDCHLNEFCGKPDGDERTWAEYTLWMWNEIQRLDNFIRGVKAMEKNLIPRRES